MTFQTLALFLLVISGLSFANGRSPAVEDFVGIEIEEPKTTPYGSESLFNLEKDVKRIETAGKEKERAIEATPQTVLVEESGTDLSSFLAICLILGLPLFTLLLVMHHLRQRASHESASNIEVLEKYRQEREKRREEKKKAS